MCFTNENIGIHANKVILCSKHTQNVFIIFIYIFILSIMSLSMWHGSEKLYVVSDKIRCIKVNIFVNVFCSVPSASAPLVLHKNGYCIVHCDDVCWCRVLLYVCV